MAMKPLLTSKHVIKKQKWAAAHRQWIVEQWKHVIWSEESRFCLHGNDGRQRVLIMPNKRFFPKHIQEKTKFQAVSVMVWGYFSAKKVSPLVVIDGTLKTEGYINILSENLLLWLNENMSGGYIFQEDGAFYHKSARSQQ